MIDHPPRDRSRQAVELIDERVPHTTSTRVRRTMCHHRARRQTPIARRGICVRRHPNIRRVLVGTSCHQPFVNLALGPPSHGMAVALGPTITDNPLAWTQQILSPTTGFTTQNATERTQGIG